MGGRLALLALLIVLAQPSLVRAQGNGVLRDVYTFLTGNTLQGFTNDSNYPNFPALTEVVAGPYFQNPPNYGDRYGDRFRALVAPPVSGTYVFYVQGHAQAALYLSTDESPFNQVPIGFNTNTALYGLWYAYASQQSSNIYLEGGRKYYLEAIHSAGTGDDNFSVGWKLPDGSFERPMPITRLYTFGLPGTTKPVITTQPTNVTVLEQALATFRVGVSNYDIVTYQWQTNGVNLAGARGATLTLPAAALANSGSSYRCVISNSFGAVTSAPVVLTVTADTTAPTLASAANSSSNLVQVSFSEPVDPVSGLALGNYALNNGVTVSGATFGASPRIVLLTANGLQRGSNYTLTVNNMSDRAAATNVIAANSQQTFTVQLKGVYREIFTNILGSYVSDLTNSAAFPNAPNSAELLTARLETTNYFVNNYGQRLRAQLTPPLTGNYIFEIAAHDTATLLLGTNSLPASARTIASVTRLGDVSARQWGVQTNQRSASVALVAGQSYYLEVLMKGGTSDDFPPDHLAVRWQMPDGSIDEPVSVAWLTPAGLNLPVLIQQPVATSVVEHASATFTVAVSNLDPVTYQWQQNGTNLPGATSATYTDASASLSESGSSIRCVVANAQGVTNSASVSLTVTTDTTAPTIASVVNNNTNRVVVTFSEPVDSGTALNPANYSIPGVALSAPALSADGLTVTLSTPPLIFGSNYTITINNVRDRATTFNTIAANAQATFTVQEFFLQNIGSPAPGTLTYVNGGLNVAAGNNDFGGTSDSLNFSYELRRGDFDVKVRVAQLDFADPATVASLMVREDLSPTNRFAAVCATPSIAGTYFQYRTAAATVPVVAGSFPVNYPYTWLRLERVGGSTFNGYASFDGQTWVLLGTATLPLSPSVYLGFAVSSRNAAAATTAQFRDFADNTSTALGLPPVNVEPPGASSRLTPMSFTEIMYHPAARLDGRKLEFVELYNSNPFDEDISGYRISGDIGYTFPAGTILKGGAFLVIARAPADITAVYGIPNVVGPYTKSLSNKSGTLRLRNRQDAIVLQVDYDSQPPWPISPDGSGHSLVLTRPSLGINNPVAWSQSGQYGGSPGRGDGNEIDGLRNVVINEFLAHTDPPDFDFVELYNHSLAPVDLSGCWLSDDPTTNKFRVPDGTVISATGFVYFTETTLGFSLSASGEAIFLVNSNKTRVVDSLKFDSQENGVSTGRVPDGSGAFQRLATKNPGAPNGAIRAKSVVINEIMYHPISEDDSDEFVELYNRGNTATNLTGWRLRGGISFDFPSNTVLAANSYLVIAKSAARLRTNYAGLTTNNTLGDYSGTLGNGGDEIKLEIADTLTSTNLSGVVTTNTIHIVVDYVAYGTGGRWGDWSDGGGSSLELIDPRSDNRLPSNWADSDDTAKGAWTTLSYTGTLDNGGASPSDWNSLQLYLLNPGECLVDNVSVNIAGNLTAVVNGGFENGQTGWEFQGDHAGSFIENVGVSPSTHSLHVVAQDRGDVGGNRIYNTLTLSYTTNLPPTAGTISASVKWLRGRPEMIFRLRGNVLENPAVMNVPKNLGTPGARNSRFVTNAGPAITEIVHSPVLPAANQPVVVSARVHDTDGLASVQLIYRIDTIGGSFTISMNDSGTGGDLVPGDGIYSATIPGQANDRMVAFYVQATDTGVPVANAKFPNNAPVRECLVHFGEPNTSSSLGTYRFWMTQNTLNDWLTHSKISSEAYQGTFIYGNYRIIYNASAHYAGSPAHAKLYDSPVGTNCDYQLALPEDDALLDETSLRIQEPGLFGVDLTCQNENFGYWLINQMGLPSLNRRPINLFVNGFRRGLIFEDTQRQNSTFDEEWFPNSADPDLNDLYRIGYWYEFGDDLSHRSDVNPSLLPFTTTGGAKKLARYRQSFNKRAIQGSPHNYTNLFNLVDILNTTATGDTYAAQVFPQVDVASFARNCAAERIINNTDLYGASRIDGPNRKDGAQNAFIFKPAGDSWKWLIWDIDAMLLGTPVDPLFDFTDPPLSNFFAHPFVLRTYWQALEDAANGPLQAGQMFPIMDARYNAYRGQGLAVSSPQSMKTYLSIRRDYILQLLADNRVDFGLTVNGGNSFTNPTTLVTLTGVAPFSARLITINGVSYPLSWSSVSNWSVRVPLTGPTNLFTVRAFDAKSNLLANATKSITVNFNGLVARAEDSLVINEIMFQPSVTNAEYIEIYNRSTNTTFGLGGYRLKGVDFDFDPAQIISPLGFLVVVKDKTAFQYAYGTSANIAGEYNKSDLDHDGETLTLARLSTVTNVLDTIISKVKYEIVTPWPSSPGGSNAGVSLQLVDAAQDAGRVSNWDDGAGWKFFSFTAVPTGARLALWLDAIGEIYIDDIRFVLGTVAGVGSNYVKNGDFETNLTSAWIFGNSYQGNSALSSLYAKTGTNSLRLAPTKAGTTASSTFMYQDIVPTPSSSSNYTVSFWYRPATNTMNLVVRLGTSGSPPQQSVSVRSVFATPGATNSIASPVNPYPLLWINEVQPTNVNTLLDNTGTAQPWIELFNSGTNTIQLGGLSLSKTYTNLSAWTFPAGASIAPGQFRVVFVDGRAQFTTGAVLHTSFRLDPTNGSIVLSRTNQILDYINYANMQPGLSYGDAPDGQLFDRQVFFYVTPGASNNPAPVPVAINEWMASNTRTILNPFNNKYDDWFELYNSGSVAVNLSGYYVTQDFGNKTMCRIPDGTVIGPNSFLLCWADGDTTQTNTFGNALHINFKLSKTADKLGLYTPAGLKVDTVSFGLQTSDVSQGRYVDGNVGGVFYSMPSATPRTNNVIAANAFAPVLAQPANRVVNEGAFVTFTNTSSDADLPPQQRTYALVTAPEGALLDPNTGVFTWLTTELDGPGVYPVTISVSDNGAPPLTDSKTFQITVNESNSAPVIAAIGTQITYSNKLVSLGIPVSDTDLPLQTFTYSVLQGPAGAGVDSAGTFTWTPSAAQAPGTNLIVVSATDSGSPGLSATQSFTVIVNPGLECGGFKGDVSPRGNPNGSVSITDWVQVGRFVAGLSDVSNACELARADCSPKPCGNGVLSITDWVQAGRYAAGVDALVIMGDCPAPGFAASPKKKTSNLGSLRTLSFTNATIARGTTNCISILLNAQGDENGLGFSIHFDTNLLTFVSATRGADAAGAPYFFANTSDLAQGLVGIAFLLPADESFSAGPKAVVKLCFRAKAGSNTVTTPLTFDDAPIKREVSDPLAEVLPATLNDGVVTLVSDTDFLFQQVIRVSNGAMNLKMSGPAGVWELQRSLDLATWLPVQRLTNTTGQLDFNDTTATNAGQRFYRAVKQ